MVGFQHDVISIDCPNMVFMWTERNRATSGRYVGAWAKCFSSSAKTQFSRNMPSLTATMPTSGRACHEDRPRRMGEASITSSRTNKDASRVRWPFESHSRYDGVGFPASPRAATARTSERSRRPVYLDSVCHEARYTRILLSVERRHLQCQEFLKTESHRRLIREMRLRNARDHRKGRQTDGQLLRCPTEIGSYLRCWKIRYPLLQWPWGKRNDGFGSRNTGAERKKARHLKETVLR